MRLKIFGLEGYLISIDFQVAIGCKQKSRQIHDSNTQDPHGWRQLMRVNSANVLDEGLRIGGRGRWMNSKIKVSQTRHDYACIENKRGIQLDQS
jgi:hypothetical protein